MNNVNNSDLAKKINDLLVMEGMSLDDIARKLKTKKKDIIKIMKDNGFIFDKGEGYFVKEETLLQRIIRLEEQQKEILELLSSAKKETLKIDSSVFEGDIIPRTFKLYKDTSEKFTKFCNENKHLKMYEILTVALEEFMDRNK